jgi:hypothetical protein
VRSRDVAEDRRAFLARLVAAGGVSIAGCARCARPAVTPLELAATDDPYAFEILEEAIVLRSGESLVDRSFVLAEEFRDAGSHAVIVVAGDDVGVRNVRILGSDPWHPEGDEAPSLPGAFGRTVGIRIENVRDVAVEQVSIEGFPGAAISGHGIAGGLFRDVTIRHCGGGIHLRHDSPNRSLRLERIHVEDLRQERPGGSAGEALALGALRDCVVIDCTAIGEMSAGFELTSPQRVRLRGLRGPTLAIRGSAELAPDLHGEPARDVVIEDCFLDKGLGRGASIFDRSCLELSQNVESARVEDCLLNAAGQNGHAIELSGNAHGRVVGCTVRGFNGVRGPSPAHAIDLSGGSTVNQDFERVNRFADQKRIRSDRNPVPR